MTAIFSILALVAAGVIWGGFAEISEQRRLRNMADEVRRRGV